MSPRGPEASTDVRELYDESYFLTQAYGWHQFAAFDGRVDTLFARARRNLDILGLQPGERFLEIGCGRGEVAIAAALTGCRVEAIDFAEPGLRLARAKAMEVVKRAGRALDVHFVCGVASDVPLEPEGYDAALLSEFIEHVTAAEGRRILTAVHGALRPGGRLLVYSYPNTLQRRLGYPLYRLAVGMFQGRWLPLRQEDTLSEHYRQYHLNEQSYLSLTRTLRRAGFATRAWYDMEPLWARRRQPLRQRLLWRTPLRHLFGTDLIALATKPT